MLSIEDPHESRKKGKRVTLKSIPPEEGKTGPYVTYWPSGFPDMEGLKDEDDDDEGGAKGLKFSTFHNTLPRKKRQQMLVASSGNIDYVGSSFQGENATAQPCRYMLGVLDKKSKTLRFLPIAADKIFRMEPRVHGVDYGDVAMRDAEGPEEEETLEEKRLMRRDLTQTFGGQKNRRTMEARERGGVQEGRIVAPEAIHHIIEKAGKEAEPAENAAQAAEIFERILPPHNLAATDVADAYPLDGLIPPEEWESLEASELVRAAKKWPKRAEELSKSIELPEYVLSRIPRIIESEKDKAGRQKRARILLYLSYMLKFHHTMIYPEKTTSQSFVEGFARMLKIPKTIVQGFLDRFAERTTDANTGRLGYVKPKKQRQLLVSYILALVLTFDGFSSDPLPITQALRINANEVLLHYREMGCKVESFNKTKTMEAKRRVSLSVPLQFQNLRLPPRNRNR